MLAEPYAESKGFWRAFKLRSPSLTTAPITSYMEGDHVVIVAADLTETDANDAQKRAYKANAAAVNYLMLCLKHMPELQREAKGNCTTAHAMFNYLQAKFKSRDATKLYADLEEDLDKLNPNDFEDGYKFVNKMTLINGDIEQAVNGNQMGESQIKVWLYRKVHKAEKGETNAWHSFVNKYEEDGILENATLVDFQKDFCRYWTTNGSPGNPDEKQHTALSITCYNCGKEGHKANECRSANKYKDSGGRVGGRGGGRFGKGEGRGRGRGGRGGRGDHKKGDKTEVLCFKCREKGHYAYECPNKKKDKDEATEIALTIIKVPSEEGCDESATCVECETQEGCERNLLHGNVAQRRAYVKFYDSDDEDDEEFIDEEDEGDDENVPELEARVEEKVTEEKVNMTVEYYEDDEDEEFGDGILDNIGDGTRNNNDTEENSIVEMEINNEGYWDVDSDEDDDSMPPLMCRGENDVEYDSDDESIPQLTPRDDNDVGYDSDDSTVQSVDERVQSRDIPRDITDMMIAEQKKRENVTAYVMMTLLDKHWGKSTGAHQDDFMLDSGANIHCGTSTDGMRNIRLNHSKVLVADKSRVTAQYKGDLPIMSEEGDAVVVLTEVRVMPNFHRNIVSLPILLSKGCTIEYANYSKIVVATKEDVKLTFLRKDDDLYYMRVKRAKLANGDSLAMEVDKEENDDNKDTMGWQVQNQNPGIPAAVVNPTVNVARNLNTRVVPKKVGGVASPRRVRAESWNTMERALKRYRADTTDMPEMTMRETAPNQVAATVYQNEEMGTTECVFNVSVDPCPDEPNPTAEATKAPEWKQWRGGTHDEYDNLAKRPAAEVPNMEAAFLCAMLEEAEYIEITEVYYNYCEATGIAPPPREQVFKLRTAYYGEMQVARPWITRFQKGHHERGARDGTV